MALLVTLNEMKSLNSMVVKILPRSYEQEYSVAALFTQGIEHAIFPAFSVNIPEVFIFTIALGRLHEPGVLH